jgi:asparagine synthase (glutamine-hydrolysing)
MPGITGTIMFGPASAELPRIEPMVQRMRHEPYYETGCLVERGLNVASGWVCHKDSFSDCMPVWNETRDICLIFWGESFVDTTEIHKLSAAGHICGDYSSAACLVHLYEEHGPEFIPLLNGCFHGLIIDLREKKVLLFNDRYGLARIYYHQSSEAFYFGAEAKAFLPVLPKLRKLDFRSLGEFLSCGCVLQGRTLFEGVSLLPPASVWTFRPGQPIQKDYYFSRNDWERLPQLTPEDYYQRLKETFTRILPRYFNGKQPVALSVTGGLDSRMIIAGAPRVPGTLPCYTFGGMYRECEDVKIGRNVAALCGQPHHIIHVDQRFFPDFLQAAQRSVYITDGAMDVTGSVGLFANQRAREFGLVRMTGNYGSEILRLNVAFKPTLPDLSMLSPELAMSTREAVTTYAEERKGNTLSFIAFKQVPWHHCSRFAEENSQLTIRSPYLDNELVRLAYQAPPGLFLHKQLALRYCEELNPALRGAPTDRGVLKRPAIVPEKVYKLWKERGPKLEYYSDYGMPHWAAKVDRALGPLHLGHTFLGQQKFYHFRTWYRNELAPAVRDVLLDPRTLQRPYLDRRRVAQMVNDHTRGTGNYTSEIHQLLTTEMIERHLIAQQ